MKKALKVILIIIGILTVLGFGGCVASMFLVGGAVNEVVEETEKESNAEQEALDEMMKNASEPKVERDEYSYTVTYTFTNNSELNFDYIELGLNVYDANDVKLGTNWTNITDIGAGQTFELSVDLYQEGAEKFDLNHFTASPFE